MKRLTLTAASSNRLLCYYNSMAEERPAYGKFNVSNIDPNKCTHLIYAFADINGNEIVGDAQQYMDFNALKESNPLLKTLLAVGGLTFSNQKFSAMVQTQKNRADFIKSVVNLLKTTGFDGLNLDWRNPGGAGGQPQDKQKFTELCEELNTALKAEGLILSASVSAERSTIDASYEVEKIAMQLDFINVLTYDFHGPWEKVIGHHSPLFQGSEDTGDNMYLNADSALKYWMEQGAPAEKLNMGFAAYGRAFSLSSNSTDVGAPASGPGEEGCYTGEEGLWSSYETCLYLEGVKTQRISDQQVPYATTDNQWVGFDDETSLATKASYLTNNNFGGAFVWSLDLDDFRGKFCDQGNSPFVSQLHDLLVPGFPQSTTTATTPQVTTPPPPATMTTTPPKTTTTPPTAVPARTTTPLTTTTTPPTQHPQLPQQQPKLPKQQLPQQHPQLPQQPKLPKQQLPQQQPQLPQQQLKLPKQQLPQQHPQLPQQQPKLPKQQLPQQQPQLPQQQPKLPKQQLPQQHPQLPQQQPKLPKQQLPQHCPSSTHNFPNNNRNSPNNSCPSSTHNCPNNRNSPNNSCPSSNHNCPNNNHNFPNNNHNFPNNNHNFPNNSCPSSNHNCPNHNYTNHNYTNNNHNYTNSNNNCPNYNHSCPNNYNNCPNYNHNCSYYNHNCSYYNHNCPNYNHDCSYYNHNSNSHNYVD
ncbi:chitinase-3-like protein 1 [Notolabrus celidotus]|uniref:chitinase-3-like protein 1 n=1 Tax=Notolabrus celidotus TaxID=1203425 RepID=UPI00148F902D|nr:chitinase-3-like protein 1 [Notolabrus celidotus]